MKRKTPSRRKRKRLALEKGRAQVPPPGFSIPDKKKEAMRKAARGRVTGDYAD